MVTQTVVFRSKVDAWLAATIIAAALVSVAAAVAVAVGTGLVQSPSLAVALAALLLIGAVLPLWILRSTYYTLDARYLYVRSGPFRWRVPLQDIRAVRPTRNPLSSPALSLDRLRVEFGRGGSIMISPGDKDGFLTELERRRQAEPTSVRSRVRNPH